ncbi:MAG: hypothetical protein IPH83_20640 [Gammaproteobacteria bacterium]|nr:hypothetical protein [Gammaproteobacteria bacterium]
METARWSRAIIVFGAVGWCLAIALTCGRVRLEKPGRSIRMLHICEVLSIKVGEGSSSQVPRYFRAIYEVAEGRINWAYNPTNAPPGVSDKVVLESLVESMAQWSAVANIQFIYRGTTRQISMDDYSDGIVAVVWTIPAAGERAGWAARAGPTAPGRVEPLGYSPSVDGSIQLNAFGLSIAESNDPEIFKESLRQYLCFMKKVI